MILTFGRGGRLGRVLVAIGDAVYLFLVSLRGWWFVWDLTYDLKLHIPLQLLAAKGPTPNTVSLFRSSVKRLGHISPRNLFMHEQSPRYIRVQDINEERVVLEEVVGLETAAITDPKVRKEFAVVGCGGSGAQK